MASRPTVCVFCGSSTGSDPRFTAAAEAMGKAIAHRGYHLVFGGGDVGLMRVVARAAKDGGSHVTGVIPEALLAREAGSDPDRAPTSELVVVTTMHERKATMAERCTLGFVAMPGGFGTFEEILEVMTWSQLGIHQLPSAFLNVAGYYDRLLAHFDHARDAGFVSPEHRAMLIEASDPDAILDAFETYRAPKGPSWLDADQR